MVNGYEYAGSGFGHKISVADKQYYSWRGREIPPTAFEIAVSNGPLSQEECQCLIPGDDRPQAKGPGPRGWLVLFRSADPSVWNTDSPDDNRFAIPVSRASPKVRFLRLRRMDTGEVLIVPITYSLLAETPKNIGDRGCVWNGAANEAFGGRHLGIAESRPLHNPPPRRHPKKDAPPKKDPPPMKKDH